MINVSLSDINKRMRIFKNKWFNHWTRDEKISDDVLHKAATEIVSGKVEAALGGSLFKKRIAKAGAGKAEDTAR